MAPDHPVFRTKYKLGIESTKPISEKVISNLVPRAKANAGINLEDSPNLLCHAFIHRFNTVLKLRPDANPPPPLIERLMGHDMKLDNSYFQSTQEQLFEEYQKGIADLSIDDKSRMIEEIKVLEHDNNELSKIQKEFKKLEEQKYSTDDRENLEQLIINQDEIVKKMQKQLMMHL